MAGHSEHRLDELPRSGAAMLRGLLTLGRPGPDRGLPDRSVVVEGHRMDLERLAAYNRVTGFGMRDDVPATWLHVLTFGLQVHLMSQPDFPFPLAGVVHVSNEMTLHRPVAPHEVLRLAVWTDTLAPHKRGVTFDVHGEVRVASELVWEGRSTYIALGATLDGDVPPSPPRLEAPAVAASQQWHLPANLGREYARVSGDPNPIHLSRITALPFGFSRPIIHGMWTHARALSALGPRAGGSHRIVVWFTKPVSLPGRVRFAAREQGDEVSFAVLNSDETKPYVVGRLTRS